MHVTGSPEKLVTCPGRYMSFPIEELSDKRLLCEHQGNMPRYVDTASSRGKWVLTEEHMKKVWRRRIQGHNGSQAKCFCYCFSCQNCTFHWRVFPSAITPDQVNMMFCEAGENRVKCLRSVQIIGDICTPNAYDVADENFISTVQDAAML